MNRYRKALVAALGVLVQLANAVAVPDSLKPWVAVLSALATALGVHQVPNAV